MRRVAYRDNKCKLRWEVQSGYKENFFTVRSAKQLNSFPREVVESPVGGFQTHLDEALDNLV